jgi:hypothetical protein
VISQMSTKAPLHRLLVAICAAALSSLLAAAPLRAQQEPAPAATPLTKEQLEQLAAPIALYPDSLLAQVFMASTYPLEVVQAARWIKANPNLKGKALEDALQKQTWDPAVKSLAAVPQALQMMNERLDWMVQLGDAFLAQKEELMAAVQNLRARAKSSGNLDSSKEMKVTSGPPPEPPPPGSPMPPEVIVIEPTNPEVVYVPSYNPSTVYGGWPYPAYPPMTWYPPGYFAGRALWFGAGVAVGAALWGNCNWGRGDVNVNVNRYNNFNRTNISNGNWNHRPEHRQGVPYRDRKTAEQFNRGERPGAGTRDSFRGRDMAARPGTADRPGARPGSPDRPGARPGSPDRPAARPGTPDRPAARPGSPDRPAARPGGDRPHTANRPTGMNQPRATNNIGNGPAARQHSSRGAQSRASSPASRPSGARSGAPRGGRR